MLLLSGEKEELECFAENVLRPFCCNSHRRADVG